MAFEARLYTLPRGQRSIVFSFDLPSSGVGPFRIPAAATVDL